MFFRQILIFYLFYFQVIVHFSFCEIFYDNKIPKFFTRYISILTFSTFESFEVPLNFWQHFYNLSLMSHISQINSYILWFSLCAFAIGHFPYALSHAPIFSLADKNGNGKLIFQGSWSFQKQLKMNCFWIVLSLAKISPEEKFWMVF